MDSNEAPGLPGRSIAWKLFLAKHEPLQASTPPRVASLLQGLRGSRDHFTQLLIGKARAPDERLTQPVPTNKTPDVARNINLNNPLSLHNENPWNEWFAGLEVKKTISQDVERTFPEMPFFRESEIQNQLTDILFVWASTRPRIGYRQGMHELLAPLYHAVYFDSVEGDAAVEPDLREVCSKRWVAADAWALFDTVMDGVSEWYEWQEPSVKPFSSEVQGGGIAGHVHLTAPTGPNGLQPWIAPIVKTCHRIQNESLKKVDPALWSAMHKAGIEPQIYGIRWLRMLFTREFSMTDSMKLWDALFACDPTLELAQWVCIAMLIRIRTNLMSGDYSSQLTTLLRYPSLGNLTVDDTPTHTCLLLQQALSLQISPTPATAATVTMENRALLGIPIEIVELDPPSPKKRSALPRNQSGFIPNRTAHGSAHSRQASTPPLGFSELLSRGLLERGESLGINKTLLGAVSELKKNIPDISAFVKSPTADLSSFPLEDERPPSERPPWEPRSRLEMEREISTLRNRDKRLGNSLGWIVDVLLQDEASIEDVDRLLKQRREAVESLSYIRDVLLSDATELEEDRLMTKAYANPKRMIEQRVEEPPKPLMVAPAPPLPVSVVDSSSRSSSDRQVIRPPPAPFSPNRSVVSSLSEGAELHLANSAPWNYTRSNFNRPIAGMASTVLPRKPPPTSSGRPDKGLPKNAGVVYDDPLGALDYSK